MQLTSLDADCLTVLATYLNGADFCRFIASSRVVYEAFRDARLVLEAAGNTRKLYSLHFWGIKEQQTRNNKQALAEVAPYFQGCFRLQHAVQPAAAGRPTAGQPEQQGQGPVHQLLVVSAAALLGGWWQPTAQPGGSEAQQLALQALQQCLGQGPADAVAALVRDERCPAAARGFWGCIVLGLMMSVCVEVPNKAAARLVRNLLCIGQPGSLFPDASAIPVICPLTAAGTAEDPGQLECFWLQAALPHYVQYHAKQFVSAAVVLVRYMKQQTVVGDPFIRASLVQLHHDLQTVLIKLHNDEQEAAVAVAQGVPGEAVWQLSVPEILPAAGMPWSTVLTSEQYRICHGAIGPHPRVEAALVMVNALAGSGKSFTLRLLQLIHSKPVAMATSYQPHGKTILYAAFNNDVAGDMANSMQQAYRALGWPTLPSGHPPNIDFRTTHQLAGEKRRFFTILPGWTMDKKPTGRQMQPLLNGLPFFQQRRQMQRAANQPETNASYSMGYMVKVILDEFCTSADPIIRLAHIPKKLKQSSAGKYEGLTPEEAVLVVQQFWDALLARSFQTGPGFGDHKCHVEHNWYLKAFVMDVVRTGRQLEGGNGRLYDIIMIDEAQDVNPVTYQLLMSQRCTVMLVGDKHQHIYGFNNAMDALAAAADEPNRPKRFFTLSHSFRLGPMVASVANMALHEMGEHRQTMIAGGRPHAAVYAMMQEPQGPPPPAAPAAGADGGAGAANNAPQPAVGAANGAAAAAAAAAGDEADAQDPRDTDAFQQWLQDNPPYQQLQLLDEPVPPTVDTPLTAVRVPLMALKRPNTIGAGGQLMVDEQAPPQVMPVTPLFLAVPPARPGTDRPYPLMFLSRSNALWFQVAAALALETRPAGAAIRAILGRPPKLFLMAAGTRVRANGNDQQLEETPFIKSVRQVYSFRYLDRAQDAQNPLRWQYTDYDTMKNTILAKGDHEDGDLRQPIIVVAMYGQQTQTAMDAIRTVSVNRREEADFILGTCHKGKGQEEMYAQLADDFITVADAWTRLNLDKPDEMNLVYVALSRAMLGLVCNRDLAQLVTAESRKQLVVEVPPALPADEEPQEQQVVCGKCYIRFDLTQAKAGTLGHLVLRPVRAEDLDDGPGPAGPMCHDCIREILWGQLVVGQAGQETQQG